MTSRRIQIIAGVLIVVAIGFGLVLIADRNREKLAAGMEAEKAEEMARAGSQQPDKPGTIAEGTADTADTVAQAVKPSFDVVRIEPSGDGVIAGLAEPGSVVDLLAGDMVIASTTTNKDGQWAIVLTKPLQPGNHDLVLRATPPGGAPVLSDEFIAVLIPETPSGEVLVVASRPGQPSEILARPASAESAETNSTGAQPGRTQVAAADPADLSGSVASAESRVQQPAGSNREGTVDGSATMATKPAAEQGADGSGGATGIVQGAEADPAMSVEPPQMADPSTGAPAESQIPGAAAEQAVASANTQPVPVNPVMSPGPAASATGTTGTGALPATASTEIPSADAPMDDPETTGSQTAATADASADATALPMKIARTDSARNGDSGASGSRRDIRADGMSGDVEDHQADPVSGDRNSQMAATAPSTTESVRAADATRISGENRLQDQQASNGQTPPVRLALDAVETEGSMVYAAGTGNPGARVRVYVDDAYIGEATANDEGRWLLETPAQIAAGNVVVRADELAAQSTEVVRRAEVPFVKQPDVVALLPTAVAPGGDAGESASGLAATATQSVIIRTGDNLWTISRRTYGRGERYTTIYKANSRQIRNPDLIYPGQVFLLPAGDSTWNQ